jgi:3-methyl-2-oxobutanoate hydroxymethyltransferase
LLCNWALELENVGVFALVLECVIPELSKKITESLKIPTIGIGSGQLTDGQVLVINDLLKMGPDLPPKFCVPIADLYQQKKQLIGSYLETNSKIIISKKINEGQNAGLVYN